ncbi:MAG: ATP-binding protein [Balneola sp.]
MDPSKLKESEVVELKESFKDDALKSLCAFANTKGGSLFLGVKDDRTLIGGEITDKTQQKIINQIESVLGIQPEVILHKNGRDEFLQVIVKKSGYLVRLRGRFYKRVGNTTREMGIDELVERLKEDGDWDSQLRDDVNYKDLAEPLTISIALSAFEKMYGTAPSEMNVEEFYERLGLIVDNKITNAALLLFGKRTAPGFRFAKVRIGRFKNESIILDDHTIGENLFNQLQKTEQIIKTLLKKRYKITGDSFQREEVWEYPIPAIREAVLNALAHRNYHITNAHIEIKIFDDHILFQSPGTLPEGITIDQLNKAHPSIRRNPLIAETFFRSGYIEQFGSGTLRMKENLKAAGHAEPEFREEGNSFVVRFDAALETIDLNSVDLNERQIKAIDLARNKELRASDLHGKFPEVNRKTITRDLTELVEMNIFEKTGTAKGTRYHLRFKQ